MAVSSARSVPSPKFLTNAAATGPSWSSDRPITRTASPRPTGRLRSDIGAGSHDEAARRHGEAAGRSRWGALAFRDVSDRFHAEDAPGVLAKLTGYELWERTQRAGQT